jgi:hypothetical protein
LEAIVKEQLSRGEIISLIAGVPLVVAASSGTASAADTAQAKAMKKTLGYVDKSKVKDDCDDCRFYKAVTKTDGTCSIIPGGTVKAAGWCKSFAKKA